MSNSNAIFNAFDYLYLNPELSAYAGVLTIEQSQVFYNTNSNAGLAYNISVIPAGFNSEVFLTSSRDLANVSSLSRDIFIAMSNQGLSQTQISKKQKYVANIYQNVQYTGCNSFVLTGSNVFGSNNVIPGDRVRIIDNMSTELFFTVSSLTNNSMIVNSNFNSLYQTSNYLLYGINVTDYDRIAQINYARIIGGYSNIDSNLTLVSAGSTSNTNYINNITDSNFDASLYKILYPDARALTDVQTYLDWVNKRKNEVYRIVNVTDIAAGNGNKYVNFNFLNISSNVVFRSNMVDGISIWLDPALCNISGDSNKLITENAIKYYTDFRLSNLQNLGSFTNMVINNDIVVTSQGTFSNNLSSLAGLYVASNSTFSNDVNIVGSVYIKSNLDVTRQSVFRNSMMLSGGNANATFCNCVLVNGSMSVTGNIYNARLGLGYMGSFLTSNNGSNIVQAQNYNDNSDRRIKTNILPMTSQECLEKICKLDIATFSYCYGHDRDNVGTTGVIAQQLEDQGLNEYVYHTSGYLPDIMKNGTIDGDYIYMEGDLEQDKTIKVVISNHDMTFRVVRKMERNVFQIAPAYAGNKQDCLIYGYQTDALKNVDYKQLFVLSLGAIKRISEILGQSNV